METMTLLKENHDLGISLKSGKPGNLLQRNPISQLDYLYWKAKSKEEGIRCQLHIDKKNNILVMKLPEKTMLLEKYVSSLDFKVTRDAWLWHPKYRSKGSVFFIKNGDQLVLETFGKENQIEGFIIDTIVGELMWPKFALEKLNLITQEVIYIIREA